MYLTHFDVFVEEVKSVKLLKLVVPFPRLEVEVGLVPVGDLVPVDVDPDAPEPVIELAAIIRYKNCQRHGHRHRHRYRQTDRQTDRLTD